MPSSYFFVDSRYRDNGVSPSPYQFKIYSNLPPSPWVAGQLEGGDAISRDIPPLYNIRLIDLTIPYLNNISFLDIPYVLVSLNNASDPGNSHFYSNNPNSIGQFFVVPLNNVDIDQHCVFATFSSNMTLHINLDLLQDFDFRILLPDGSSITPIPPPIASYHVFAAPAGSTSVVLVTPTDALFFLVGNKCRISTINYVITNIDYTTGEIFFFPGLDTACSLGDLLLNTTDQICDRVTALFELTPLIPRNKSLFNV